MRIYREYLLKGNDLYDVFILLVCLNLLHIADGCIPPHFMQECLSRQLALKYPILKLKSSGGFREETGNCDAVELRLPSAPLAINCNHQLSSI